MPANASVDDAVEALRVAYQAFEASGDLVRFLRAAFAKLFDPTGYATAAGSAVAAYQAAIESAFFDADEDRRLLDDDDRERILVALLAHQGAEGNLALHIYLALMEGVTPGEIAEILFLAGIYTAGVNRLTQGLKIANVVFQTLVELHQKMTPGAMPPQPPEVFVRILSQFPDEKALLGDVAAAGRTDGAQRVR
jgi:alkylhydroperoxidase/carboxymuconolactone decarboxylase family protein YurZ